MSASQPKVYLTLLNMTKERFKLPPKFTHKQSGTKFYRIWANIKKRINDKNSTFYYRYGGRGIKYCEKWERFENFYEDMNESYQAHCEEHGAEDTTIERINNNGNYCKENCRWATKKEQANNRNIVKRIDFNGKSLTLTEWCEEIGLSYDTLRGRLYHYGWTIEKALTTKKRYAL